MTIRKNLLKIIEIPRELGTMNLSLHTFCDASKLACGIVIDLRSGNENEVNVRFVAAKSKLAPENSTIPRLELFAASMGSQLAHEVNEGLSNKIPNYFWSDSTTVLAWINRDLQWGRYVHNRVIEIRSLTKMGAWRYVPRGHKPGRFAFQGVYC